MKVLAAFSDACTLHATGSFSTSFCVTRNKCVTESSSFWADVIFLYLAARRGSFLPMFVALRSMSFYGQSVFSFVDGIKQNRATSETSAGNPSKRPDNRRCCMSLDGIQADHLWRRVLHPLKMTLMTPRSYNHSRAWTDARVPSLLAWHKCARCGANGRCKERLAGCEERLCGRGRERLVQRSRQRPAPLWPKDSWCQMLSTCGCVFFLSDLCACDPLLSLSI